MQYKKVIYIFRMNLYENYFFSTINSYFIQTYYSKKLIDFNAIKNLFKLTYFSHLISENIYLI